MGRMAELRDPDRIGSHAAHSGRGRMMAKPNLATGTIIYLIEDDPALREAGRDLFESQGWVVRDFFSAEAFLAAPRPSGDVCLILDVLLPGLDGLTLLEKLRAEGSVVPAIMLTGLGDAATAVAALKAGAADFIEKPAERTALIASIADAIKGAKEVRTQAQLRDKAKARFRAFTTRETEVLTMMLEGMPNKNIAAGLSISQRTVEGHRARLMHKCGVKSLPALMELYLLAHQTN
ncbi:response regulator transcription factor [Tabrizicola sp. WMC-M-20]|nr:response regulator transcription factor [Tabrizicola sp. WMC-M-20]